MIPKINQDLESARHQKNMTDTQKRNDTYIKEGIIVNSYVKDPLLEGPKASILDETCDTLVISNTNIDLPQRVYEKEAKKQTRSCRYAALQLVLWDCLAVLLL